MFSEEETGLLRLAVLLVDAGGLEGVPPRGMPVA
jgi:hypothetical protein